MKPGELERAGLLGKRKRIAVIGSGISGLATASLHAAPEVVAAFRAGAAPVRAERRLEMPPLASAY